MIIAIEICQDNFIYCKIWTQNLDIKTSKKPKERVKDFDTLLGAKQIFAPSMPLLRWLVTVETKYQSNNFFFQTIQKSKS